MPRQKKTIITCAITGAIHTPTMSDALPYTADDIAGQAIAAAEAGAAILHLHARRLRMPHPDGKMLDVTAELPEHFANSLAALGFSPELGDRAFAEAPQEDPKTVQKRAAKAHAKDRRRARRGERRSRGDRKRR